MHLGAVVGDAPSALIEHPPLCSETTWSARTWLSFVSQRLSVATQLAAAQEVAEALGLSVAADPRLQ